MPLWRGDHVAIRQLVDDFARYLYLPRLSSPDVLLQAIRDGVSLVTWRSDTFAYAERHDETAGRYRGLRGGQVVTVTVDDAGMLVKPDIAWRQLEVEIQAPEAGGTAETTKGGATPGSEADIEGAVGGRAGGAATSQPAPPLPRRFYGTVRLDPTRVGRDASRIAEEVIAHLIGQVGAEVTVTLEIEATLPNGASDQIVRIVTENSRTLKFVNHGFEKE